MVYFTQPLTISVPALSLFSVLKNPTSRSHVRNSSTELLELPIISANFFQKMLHEEKSRLFFSFFWIGKGVFKLFVFFRHSAAFGFFFTSQKGSVFGSLM